MKGPKELPRLNASYLLGVYLGVNAVPDAYLLVDGPDCALYKAEFIYGQHDLGSSLLDCEGRHRIAYTSTYYTNIAADREPAILRMLASLRQVEDCGVVLLCPLPLCAVAGTDYGRLIGKAGASGPPVLEVPSKSLSGDWLDGYGETLKVLARGMDLSGAGPRPGNVAIVGHLMDRTEPDQLGNLAELRRLLEGLGLNLVSVWLGNESYGRLSEVKNAGAILSLPYGREAARILAGRLGARLLELEIPFGLGPTRRWIRKIAGALGLEERAEGLIREEMRTVVRRLEWVVSEVFLGKRAVFCGDPYLFEGFAELASDLGCELAGAAILGREGHARRMLQRLAPRVSKPLIEPSRSEWEAFWERRTLDPVDLVIQNSLMAAPERPGSAVLEFGFPSYRHHALTENPFLGFKGCLSFVERMLNALVGRGGR